MPDKAGKYVKGEHGDDGRRDAIKLRQDEARKCVRKIQSHPVLSAEWITLVDSLHQLARLAQLDGLMPPNLQLTETLGRNNESDGTLWDQEANENTIRVLVEEAKVNLCLRIMNDYKQWHYDPSERSQTISKVMQEHSMTEPQLERTCLQFEESLGLLLYQSFEHVETLQLTDLPFLIEHIALVLTTCGQLELRAPSNAKTQETVVCYYFSSLMSHAEKLNNSELLAKTAESGLLELISRHIQTHQDSYPLEVVETVCKGLSYLADNEDFQTTWKDFFTLEGQKEQFQQMEAVCSKVIEQMPEKRKELRPLTDFFNKMRRAR